MAFLVRCESKYGAGEGNRTPDLRFTKPLLYRLSYAGQTAAWAVTSGRRSHRVQSSIDYRRFSTACFPQPENPSTHQRRGTLRAACLEEIDEQLLDQPPCLS